MNLVQITPGAGGMYCGNCLRDNALVAALRRGGHAALMVPLYLPLTLDEPDQSSGTPLFFGGVNVYLDQKSALYRKAPSWLRRWLDSPALLKWAGGRAAKTRAEEVGELMSSMLRGEEGNQTRQLGELVAWLKAQSPRPDVICLSNALLAGLTRQIKTELGVPVVCMLQGEDAYLDALPEPHRARAWQILSERAQSVALFIAPSHYYAGVMQKRLGLSVSKVQVVWNGISLEGYGQRLPQGLPTPCEAGGTSALQSDAHSASAPVLGYFARMCREKGLDLLVDAFIALKRRGGLPHLTLRVGGSCGPADEPFVESLRRRLQQAGCLADAQFYPNLDRAQKIAFLQSLSLFSVPALSGEAFGLYLLEALAAGVPAVQPRHGAFPELIEATGGGLVCEPTSAALAEGLEQLLLAPERARALGDTGRRAVAETFTAGQMAARFLAVLESYFSVKPAAGTFRPSQRE